MNAPSIIASVDPGLAKGWSGVLNDTQVEQLIVRAIYAGQVAEVARALVKLGPKAVAAAGIDLAQAAVSACEAIAEACASEQRRMLERLIARQVTAQAPQTDSEMAEKNKQNHSYTIETGAQSFDQALAVAADEGYLSCEFWSAGGLRAAQRTIGQVTLIKTDGNTMRMVLRRQEKTKAAYWPQKLRPSHRDYRSFGLPGPLWPFYYLLKPYRALAERLFGWYKNDHQELFLGTPNELIRPLLDFAEVDSSDKVVDLGCGDGRIVIGAAQMLGCRALGIEKNPALADLACAAIKAAAVDSLARIERADIKEASIDDATVMFLFLPVNKLAPLLELARQRLTSGSRIVVHEQMPLPAALRPDCSKPIITASALTVAHLWTVR